jgi:hypothetical protein
MKSSRVIKFRAWDIQMGNMLDWNYLMDKQGSYLNSKYLHVMQFTGCYDVNGKEIYEGDIIKHRYFSKKVIADVSWSNEQGYYLAIEPDGSRTMLNPNSEIIGNVYETPELLTN